MMRSSSSRRDSATSWAKHRSNKPHWRHETLVWPFSVSEMGLLTMRVSLGFRSANAENTKKNVESVKSGAQKTPAYTGTPGQKSPIDREPLANQTIRENRDDEESLFSRLR